MGCSSARCYPRTFSEDELFDHTPSNYFAGKVLRRCQENSVLIYTRRRPSGQTNYPPVELETTDALRHQSYVVEVGGGVRAGARVELIRRGEATTRDDDIPTDIGIAATGGRRRFHRRCHSTHCEPCDKHIRT